MRPLSTCTLSFALAALIGCSATVSVKPIDPNSKPGAAGTCSSNFLVRLINPKPNPGGAVCGVPFRAPAHYTIRVYQSDGKGGYKEIKERFVENLPNPDELYALNFSAKALSNQKVGLKFNPSGTLNLVDLSGASQQADEAIKAFGDQAVGLYSAIQNRGLTELKAQKDALDASKAVLEAQDALRTATNKPTTNQGTALVAALEALNAAREAEREWSTLINQVPKPSAALIAAAEDKLRLARLKANLAYRQAGLEPPFSDVFP